MKRLKASYGCPVELALDFVGGKWKTVILARLKEEPHRYAELRARIGGISDKVLTERLKDLERLELVEKRSAADASIVYHLTDRGESLRPVLEALYRWGDHAAGALPVTVRRG
ncbi:helix-turn-helix domain-containing protein [Sphingomonas sp. HF-S4]|uniref:Helix-turn-helix domain-containing protein n=1 Tax=Sphingomonas agrestis TaxID=3080540 RepID=A0ABU3YDE5_9SPHN|nr:helix-turn-helix domain-containing protein [Sphingomonas sp. HF-S4]MDV3459302.1 helix-turn-helix domain-containing protein [Sphingomonas sp. HF-S4]